MKIKIQKTYLPLPRLQKTKQNSMKHFNFRPPEKKKKIERQKLNGYLTSNSRLQYINTKANKSKSLIFFVFMILTTLNPYNYTNNRMFL